MRAGPAHRPDACSGGAHAAVVGPPSSDMPLRCRGMVVLRGMNKRWTRSTELRTARAGRMAQGGAVGGWRAGPRPSLPLQWCCVADVAIASHPSPQAASVGMGSGVPRCRQGATLQPWGGRALDFDCIVWAKGPECLTSRTHPPPAARTLQAAYMVALRAAPNLGRVLGGVGREDMTKLQEVKTAADLSVGQRTQARVPKGTSVSIIQDSLCMFAQAEHP